MPAGTFFGRQLPPSPLVLHTTCAIYLGRRAANLQGRHTASLVCSRAARVWPGRTPRWDPLSQEALPFWGHCEVCGNGDGTLVCEACQGQGLVATKPGGAGVQYYIGNAQCKACRGLGFEPCPICVGYEAKLTPPNPSEGPASLDDLDRLISTMRWLRGFPDSRARKAGRSARRKQGEGHCDPGLGAGVTGLKREAWEQAARRFYLMHGAEQEQP